MKLGRFGRLTALALIAAGIWFVLPAEAGAAATWGAPLAEPLTVTRPFDPPEDPYGPGHRGVDLAGSPGQQVRAAGAGTVVYAGPLAGRGVISVQHADGLRTTYEPVLSSVSAGVQVALGEVIGTLDPGHQGCPVSACLHWGLKRGEVYLDPMLLLYRGPVRLLPRYGDGGPDRRVDPALALSAGTLALSMLGLGVRVLPLAGRQHCTHRARKPGDPSGAIRTERRTCAAHNLGRAQPERNRGVRRADVPGDRPP